MDPQSPANIATASSSQHQTALPNLNPYNKGRVRTGCLVCRVRKVKCDEQQPSCRNCTRLKTCVYRAPGKWRQASTPRVSEQEHSDHQLRNADSTVEQSRDAYGSQYPIDEPPPTLKTHLEPQNHETQTFTNDSVLPDEVASAPVEGNEESLNHHTSDILYQNDYATTVETPSDRYHRASQLIYFSTTMDWLAASEELTPSSFTYFINDVDCPFIAPFDQLNWTRVKAYVAQIALRQNTMAISILAVQVIYRAQVDRLPIAHAMSVFQTAINGFEAQLDDDTADIDIILITAFLLCVCVATLSNEDVSVFGPLNGDFVTKLKYWLINDQISSIALRLCAWLLLLNTSTQRPGSIGLFAQPLCDLLYTHIKDIPNLSHLDQDTHPENGLYDMLSTPIFAFYLEVQKLSKRVVDITHYRRQRNTPEDQAEVSDIAPGITAHMRRLWDNRPAPLRLTPEKLCQNLGSTIANPLVALAGSCIAAFHTETIVIGRILGDPPSPTPAALHAKQEIWDIIEGDWNAISEGTISPAYVRPLFVYALESFREEETGWVVSCLRRVKDPVSRSGFLADFVEAHGEAQRGQGRRVTMKYFCYQKFGVPLPYM